MKRALVTLAVISFTLLSADVIARRLLITGGGGGAGGGGASTSVPVLGEFEVLPSPKGGWTWFNDPRAVYYNGKTYFGYIDGSGDPYAAQYVHSTELTSTTARLYPAQSPFEVDDHDNPAFLIRDSDKRILAFFSTHTSTNQYVNISTNPEDATSWAGPTNVAASIGGNLVTYANPVQLTGEVNDPIYFFFRDHYDGVNAEWAYSKSTDGGVTWGTKVSVVRLTYSKNVPNGDSRIDFVASPHASSESTEHSIYHFYYQGGSWFKSDGTSAGGLPLAASSLTKVYSGAGAADHAWLWDIAIGSDGHPRIVFATFPSVTDHRYQYARWTGSTWVVNQIVAAGGSIYPSAGAEDHYSGGVVLDQSDPNIVWASVGVGGGVWELRRYATGDGGSTWSSTTLASSGKNVRPVSIRNHDGGKLIVLWMDGTYTTYTNYSVATKGAGY